MFPQKETKMVDDDMRGQPTTENGEFDWNVADNQVVTSPGGLDSVHHHYTKGFYGSGGASWDKFGHQPPRYLSGVYGNLYNTGPSATDQMGYYPPMQPNEPKYWENQSPPNKEEFELVDGVTEIGNNRERFHGNSKSFHVRHPAVLFIVLIIVWFVIWQWNVLMDMGITKIFGPKKSMMEMFVICIILTAIMIGIIYFTGFSIVTFDQQ